MKISFVGAGNMANAILSGIHKANVISKSDIYVSNRTIEKLEKIKKSYGYNISVKNAEVIKKGKDIVFICVKPQVFDTIIPELKKEILKDQIVVSIMAGKTIDYIKKSLGVKKVIRIMPNTPCLVGTGISTVSSSKEAKSDKRYNEVLNIIKTTGSAYEVDEKYINAITQVSGASPAFVFMMIEALADGGVYCGLPRDMAYLFAKVAVYGSGKLAVASEMHPGALKDMVTSPAGTTIEGVKILESRGFRGALIDAVVAAYQKTLKL